MNKEVVVHKHNGISLRYVKERIRVRPNEVDETGAYYAEWNKEKTNAVYQCIYMEFRKMVMTQTLDLLDKD